MLGDQQTTGMYSCYIKWKWRNKKHKFLKQYYVLNFNSKAGKKINYFKGAKKF